MAESGFGRFFLRVTACHMVTYFVAGILAFTLLDYATAFQSPYLACWMRPTTSRVVTTMKTPAITTMPNPAKRRLCRSSLIGAKASCSICTRTLSGTIAKPSRACA